MVPDMQPTVDQSVIKVSQSATISVMVVAFLLDSWVLVALVAAVNLLGVLSPSVALWRQLYLRLLKPSGIIHPQVIHDNPEPHRFASAVGGVLAGVAAIVLVAGSNVIGWVLGWLLIGLAALNVFAGFCLGCFFYYQLHRLGIPGFNRSPVDAVKRHVQSDDRV